MPKADRSSVGASLIHGKLQVEFLKDYMQLLYTRSLLELGPDRRSRDIKTVGGTRELWG